MSMTEEKLEALILSLRPCRVAVVGDVMLDRYVKGHIERISPEAPIQVLDVAEEYQMPGGAANVAMKALGLGSNVRLVGLVGDDPAAAELRALLASDPRVTWDLVVDAGLPTTVKTRFIASNQ